VILSVSFFATRLDSNSRTIEVFLPTLDRRAWNQTFLRQI